MQMMIEQGVLRLVDEGYPKRYLPLLAVVDMERESTKVRVCLDAKTKFQGLCLNDILLKGKLVMPDILRVLITFRAGKFALLGDIQKMFWQIKLNIEDQKYHGTIWKGKTYVFTRVCFGEKPSPPIAEESMLIIAYRGKDSHPEASKTLINKRYMDDIVESSDSEIKLLKKRAEIDDLLGKFGFKIKLWYSNDDKLGNNIASKSVLGCKWNIGNDTLAPNTPDCKINTFSKRAVLSKIAEIWDPLGLCVGVMISARLVFQSIVRLKLGWDEPVNNASLFQKWNSCLTEMAKCKYVVISRHLNPPIMTKENGELVKFKCSLIGFCDGSNVANGCVLYLRWYNEDESIINVNFVAA